MAAKPPPYGVIHRQQTWETDNAHDPNADTLDDLRPIGRVTELDDTQPMKKPQAPRAVVDGNKTYDKDS